jgi:hypothetical protein
VTGKIVHPFRTSTWFAGALAERAIRPHDDVQ